MVDGPAAVTACAMADGRLGGLYTKRHRPLIDKGLSSLLITSHHVTLLSHASPPPAVIAGSGSGERERE